MPSLQKNTTKLISSAVLLSYLAVVICSPLTYADAVKLRNAASHLLGVFIGKVYAAEEDELYYIHTDHLGSTTVITDKNGEVVQHTRNYPYGADRTIQQDSNAVTERKFTGQIRDSSTSLYYYNARYYDPGLGTFISADEEGDTLNRYTYVHSNPLRGIDPTGRQTDVTNPGSGDSQLPGISPSGAYVNTVASTTIENAYQSDYEPTATDRALFYGVVGSGAAICTVAGGMFAASVGSAAAYSVASAAAATPLGAAALNWYSAYPMKRIGGIGSLAGGALNLSAAYRKWEEGDHFMAAVLTAAGVSGMLIGYKFVTEDYYQTDTLSANVPRNKDKPVSVHIKKDKLREYGIVLDEKGRIPLSAAKSYMKATETDLRKIAEAFPERDLQGITSFKAARMLAASAEPAPLYHQPFAVIDRMLYQGKWVNPFSVPRAQKYEFK